MHKEDDGTIKFKLVIWIYCDVKIIETVSRLFFYIKTTQNSQQKNEKNTGIFVRCEVHLTNMKHSLNLTTATDLSKYN